MRNALYSAMLAVCLVSGGVPALSIASGHGEAYSIARGGRLYDKWFKESKEAAYPESAHPAYPEGGAYHGKKGSDWRCKECHGWDYRGVEGAYGSGKHHTGIKGIAGAKGNDPASIVAVLQNELHGYGNSGMSEQDYQDLALFVSKGQVDMSGFVDADKRVAGDLARGQDIYETVCASCHGLDGKLDENMPPLGELANKNPWEVMHKVLFGQPKEEMPAMHVFGAQTAADVTAHLQTLPKE